jgi:hypothetical protein
MKHRDGSLEKAARLIVLLQLQEGGQLDGLSLQKIANLFREPPHRSTILRDLRDTARLRELLKQIKVE